MAETVETYRGAIYPWHCDHQGHVTVMHYMGFFDHASWQIISALGFPRARLDAERRGFVDVKATIEYREELHVGEIVHIASGLTRIGTTSIVAYHQLFNSETGALSATNENVMLYFDLEARQKVALPEADRDRLQGFLLEL